MEKSAASAPIPVCRAKVPEFPGFRQGCPLSGRPGPYSVPDFQDPVSSGFPLSSGGCKRLAFCCVQLDSRTPDEGASALLPMLYFALEWALFQSRDCPPVFEPEEDSHAMPSRTRRTVFSLTVFFAVCALLGSVISKKVGAQSEADESNLRSSLRSFTSVYEVVEQNYAEPIEGDKPGKVIYDGAIPGMLRVLDPHSNFYDPKAYAKMREDQHGRYYGVGMLIQPQNNKVVVVVPHGRRSCLQGRRPSRRCDRLHRWQDHRTI